ncbi:MAG: RagB/SusD family nutrient uptake outer membrane protein [Bergeyella sp.]
MKNKIFLSGIIAIAGLFSSCSDDFLQENYSDPILISYDENTIKTNDDLQKFIRGLYSRFGTSSFSGDYFTYQELTGDLGFVSIKNSGYFVNTNAENHLVVDGGASSGIWASLYNTIANANLILAYEGKVPDADEEGVVASKTLFAHAKVIRAYNYLALLELFSPNYGEGDQSLGVPYPVTYDIEAQLPRETVPNVINNIIADLTSSLADFEADGYSAIYSNNNSFNSDAIKLLLARAYLYKKDYANAIAYADQVISLGGELVGGTGNTGNTTFSTIFTLLGETNQEILFQIEENSVIPSNNNIQTYWGISGSYKQNFLAYDFWNSFPTTDVRKSNTAWYQNNATTYPDDPKPINVKKYLNGPRDVVMLRKTEAFFIKAEAQYHSDPAAAFTTLKNWIVTHRDPGYTKSLTGTDVLDEILRHKGFEFFLEGTRFTDLKRNNKAIVKVQTANGVSIGGIPVGDKRFIWPIPLSEMQTNPNIKQAPGY